jgi:uncharacterized membrane protein YeaQ/YmgE (transglycosylase-associated protein family)
MTGMMIAETFELAHRGMFVLEMKMTLLEFVVLVVIATIAGAIGQAIAGYSLGGCVISALVGFVGAYIGVWLARELGLPEFLNITVGTENFPLVWSIIGSAILSAILGLLLRRRWA